MPSFFLTLDWIAIFCSVYSNYCSNEMLEINKEIVYRPYIRGISLAQKFRWNKFNRIWNQENVNIREQLCASHKPTQNKTMLKQNNSHTLSQISEWYQMTCNHTLRLLNHARKLICVMRWFESLCNMEQLMLGSRKPGGSCTVTVFSSYAVDKIFSN